MAPYKSLAQAGYFHEHPEKVGGMKVVKEWDQATKGMHLPEHAHAATAKKARKLYRKATRKRRPKKGRPS